MWKRACDTAARSIAGAKEYNKHKWDKSQMDPDFKEGDQVLVSTLNFNNLKGLSQPQIINPPQCPLQPLQPVVHGTVRPLLAQGGSSEAPNHKWAHPSQLLTQNPKNHLRTQIGHKSVHGLWKPLEATRSAPSKNSPPVQGKTSLCSMHFGLKDQEWCIYGIIYHYAQLFLGNPMVTLSEPNYISPNQVPSPSPFSKKDFSAIQSGNSLVATRKPFKDPNQLALQRLGCHLLIRTIMKAIIRGYQSFQ
ncbi:hypothetical protein O181_093773 [Austropuccinia psidii MF-1]|uniref:Uncharacterized protein n=1 Tax=Austropuccinia psidii MF-1 TaxID=1389203 RepID=A0A9Q3P9M8_9BASI|nr:hypothetical protein [Austropuccinia psidii MF-1]